MSEFRLMWDVADLLRLAAWPAIIVLAFLQLRFFVAIIYIVPAAIITSIAIGFFIARAARREISETLLVFRFATAVVVAATIYLWAQALTA